MKQIFAALPDCSQKSKGKAYFHCSNKNLRKGDKVALEGIVENYQFECGTLLIDNIKSMKKVDRDNMKFMKKIDHDNMKCIKKYSELEFSLNYNVFRTIGGNWSSTGRYNDYSMPYPLVDYTNYADSMDEFIITYPKVIIETCGMANSPSTFGFQGSRNSGPMEFDTINFNNTEFRRKHLVYVYEYAFWWSTSVEIGIGFKTEGNRLYLQCFIDGWIYGGGHVWRELNFGLRVTKITFIPKSNTKRIAN